MTKSSATITPERRDLAEAYRHHAQAAARVAEAQAASNKARDEFYRIEDRLEELKNEPAAFDDLDDALNAISVGVTAVLARSDPKKAERKRLQEELTAWSRAREQAAAALDLRAKDAAVAESALDHAARNVIASEVDFEGLRTRYAAAAATVRQLRAELHDLWESTPSTGLGADVHEVMSLATQYGPETSTIWRDLLSRLKKDPDARAS